MSEPKQKPSESEEPRKPGRPEIRTSLAPLKFEEALRELIATGPPEHESPKKSGDKKPRI